VNLIATLILQHGLLLVFATTLASRIGAPVPAAPVLVVAGAAAMQGQLSWLAVLLLAVVGNTIGDGVWFWAGRKFGYKVLKLLCRISMSPDSCVRQSESFITRWGGGSLIAAKFVPGVSVVAPPMAGALGMSWLAFLGYETLAAAIWTVLFLGLGAVFAEQVQGVLNVLSAMGLIALLVLALAVLAYLGWRYWRRKMFLRGVEMARISVLELRSLIDGGHEPVVIDVRSEAGRAIDSRRIPGALGIDIDSIKHHIERLPRDREIVLYCACPNEVTAASAARVLAAAGFQHVRPLLGGLNAWVEAGHRIDSFGLAVTPTEAHA